MENVIILYDPGLAQLHIVESEDKTMINRKKLILAAILSIAAIAAAYGMDMIAFHSHGPLGDKDAVNHSGGLDACGGHWNHSTGTYHYHQGPWC